MFDVVVVFLFSLLKNIYTYISYLYRWLWIYVWARTQGVALCSSTLIVKCDLKLAHGIYWKSFSEEVSQKVILYIQGLF